MSPRAWNIFWIAVAAVIVILCCNACSAGPAPAHIALPTTAAVRAPLATAKTHVDRSVALGVQEQALATVATAKGIKSNSQEAAQLSTLLSADAQEKRAAQDQLTATLYQVGEMDRLQASKQAQIDALAKHDARETGLASAEAVTIKKVVHSRLIWIGLFLLSLVADFFCGAFIEKELRWIVGLVWKWIAVGYHLGAGVLKAAFPLYTFWLPA